jgi:hypothetical protein
MTVPTDDVSKEIRAQRHDFIKEYYKMAAADLDRHLKGSWQTIVTVATTVAAISLAQDNKLPAPFAVAVSSTVGFWGLCNLIDGNYWSLRAIAFLSNVEAIYFSDADRKNFNPYIGYHPPLKLLDSLRYQFFAVSLFILLGIAFMAWRMLGGGLGQFEHKLTNAPMGNVVFWLLPICIVLGGVAYTISVWLDRTKEYLAFVEAAPGPGVINGLPGKRTVDLILIDPSVSVTTGADVQANLVEKLKAEVNLWSSRRYQAGILSGLAIVFILGVVICFRMA